MILGFLLMSFDLVVSMDLVAGYSLLLLPRKWLLKTDPLKECLLSAVRLIPC